MANWLFFLQIVFVPLALANEKPDFASSYSLFQYTYEPKTCSPVSSTAELSKFIEENEFTVNSPEYYFKKYWQSLLSKKLQSCGYWIKGDFIKESEPAVKPPHPTCYTPETISKMPNKATQFNRSCENEFPRGLTFSTPLDLYHHKPSSLPQHFYDLSSIPLGKVLVFRGNSLSRQLFFRLIAFIRKIPFIVEHYTHKTMWYAFDHEKDFLFTDTTQVKLDVKRYQIIKSIAEKNGFVEGRYTLLIMSFPVYDCEQTINQISSFADGVSCQLPLWIGIREVPMHWRFYKINRNIEKNDKNEINKNGMIIESINIYPYNNFGPQNHTWEERHHYSNQNIDYKQPVRNTNCISSTKNNPRCRSYALHHSDTHFMCSFEYAYPANIHQVKFPPNGDCTDTVNLNIVQRFLAYLFDERV